MPKITITRSTVLDLALAEKLEEYTEKNKITASQFLKDRVKEFFEKEEEKENESYLDFSKEDDK